MKSTKFINDYMGNVVMSLDGRPETNDRMRFRQTAGHYDVILPKIIEMADREGRTIIM